MYEQHIQQYFNHTAFRPGQEEIVASIMNGRDVVALMPTGGGKSLCYQLPALAGDLFTVVISPLIALMKDQVDSLRARGIAAHYINSSLGPGELDEVKDAMRAGKSKILYVAPERLQNAGFRTMLQERDVRVIAIDEAHCVSQWGHDFRPEYLRIKDFIAGFKQRPTIAAFTATATPEVKDEIVARLHLQNPSVHVRGFDRPNLKFFARSGLKKKERAQEVLRIVKATPGNGIIYTITRKAAEETAQFLHDQGIAAAPYHAGLDPARRSRVQEEFMQNRLKVIVATIAFGMGVDKADVRFVIHAGMPSSLEGYYQEAGRAGRDGEQAYCILLASKADTGLHYHFIQKSKEEMQSQGKSWNEINQQATVRFQRLDSMRSYAEGTGCRRKAILEYFSDPDAVHYQENNCRGCDVCLNYVWEPVTADTKPKRDRRVATETNEPITNTVMETVRMYQQGMAPEKIAVARSMAQSTIFGHLLRWYDSGGDFKLQEFITPDEEKQILHAMAEADDYTKLKPIKDKLPEEMSYEKIRMVIAKIRKISV